jgi:hypothetical protein
MQMSSDSARKGLHLIPIEGATTTLKDDRHQFGDRRQTTSIHRRPPPHAILDNTFDPPACMALQNRNGKRLPDKMQSAKCKLN